MIYLENNSFIYRSNSKEWVFGVKDKMGLLLITNLNLDFTINKIFSQIIVFNVAKKLPIGKIEIEFNEFEGINIIKDGIILLGNINNFSVNNELDGIEDLAKSP